jgi:hypothetical protein
MKVLLPKKANKTFYPVDTSPKNGLNNIELKYRYELLNLTQNKSKLLSNFNLFEKVSQYKTNKNLQPEISMNIRRKKKKNLDEFIQTHFSNSKENIPKINNTLNSIRLLASSSTANFHKSPFRKEKIFNNLNKKKENSKNEQNKTQETFIYIRDHSRTNTHKQEQGLKERLHRSPTKNQRMRQYNNLIDFYEEKRNKIQDSVLNFTKEEEESLQKIYKTEESYYPQELDLINLKDEGNEEEKLIVKKSLMTKKLPTKEIFNRSKSIRKRSIKNLPILPNLVDEKLLTSYKSKIFRPVQTEFPTPSINTLKSPLNFNKNAENEELFILNTEPSKVPMLFIKENLRNSKKNTIRIRNQIFLNETQAKSKEKNINENNLKNFQFNKYKIIGNHLRINKEKLNNNLSNNLNRLEDISGRINLKFTKSMLQVTKKFEKTLKEINLTGI